MPKVSKYPGVQARGRAIQVSFDYLGERRRETIKLSPVPENFRHCYVMLETIKDEITKGTFDYVKWFPQSKWLAKNRETDATVEQAMRVWFNTNKVAWTSSSIQAYEVCLNRLSREIGSMPLDAIDGNVLMNLIETFRKRDLATRTIRNTFLPLRGAISDAIFRGKMNRDPFVGLKLKPTKAEKRKDQMKTDIDPFSLNEIGRILDVATGQNQNYIQTNLYSGLRSGEMIGLAWEDIDLEARTATIYRAFTVAEWTTTKTDKSYARVIELQDPVIEALKRQKQFTYMKPAVDCGIHGHLHLVFYDPLHDAPWVSTERFRMNQWVPLLRKAGVRYRYPYQMRHTFASQGLSAGLNPKWIAEQLGHTDVTMVFRNYGKWLPSAAVSAGHNSREVFNKLWADSRR